MIMVFVLAGFCAYLYTKVMALENKETQGMSDNEFNQLMSIVDNMIDKSSKSTKEQYRSDMTELSKNTNSIRKLINQDLEKVSVETIKDACDYTDQRIKSLHDKFFKVINLDSQ